MMKMFFTLTKKLVSVQALKAEIHDFKTFTAKWLSMMNWASFSLIILLFLEVSLDVFFNSYVIFAHFAEKLPEYCLLFTFSLLIVIYTFYERKKLIGFEKNNVYFSSIFTTLLILIMMFKMKFLQSMANETSRMQAQGNNWESQINIFTEFLTIFLLYMIIWTLTINYCLKRMIVIVHNIIVVIMIVCLEKMSIITIVKMIIGQFLFCNLLIKFSSLITSNNFSAVPTSNSNKNNKKEEKPQKVPEDIKPNQPDQEDWKDILNDLPHGVALISLKKKVLYQNYYLNELFGLENPNKINPNSGEYTNIFDDFVNSLKKSNENLIGNANNEDFSPMTKNGMKKDLIYQKLVEKIGVIEELKDDKTLEEFLNNHNNDIKHSEPGFSIMESSEFTINSYINNSKKIIIQKPILKYNPVNILSNSFYSWNKQSSSSSKSSNVNKNWEFHSLQQEFLAPKPEKSDCSSLINEKFLSEVTNNLNESINKTMMTKKIDLLQKEYTLDHVLNKMRVKIKENLKKTSENPNSREEFYDERGFKTYCTPYKNCKETSSKTRMKYELKIKSITYKQQPAFLLLIQDVSYRDLVKELRENNEYKTKVLTTLSHELRTPLNGAISPLEKLLDEEGLHNEFSQEVSKAYHSMMLLQSVLNDVVDFALINSNQLYLNYEEMNFQNFLENTLDLFSRQAEEKGVDLELEFAENCRFPSVFKTDFQRLRQILVSLLSNSLKNTFAGTVRVLISCENPGKSRETRENFEESLDISCKSIAISQTPSNFSQSLSDFSEIHKRSPLKVNEKPGNSAKNLKTFLIRLTVQDSGIGILREKLDNIRKCLKTRDLLEVCANLNRTLGCGVGLTISHCLALLLGPRDSKGLEIHSEIEKGTEISFVIEVFQEKTALDLRKHDVLSVIEENNRENSRYSSHQMSTYHNHSKANLNKSAKTLCSSCFSVKKQKKIAKSATLREVPREKPTKSSYKSASLKEMRSTSDGSLQKIWETANLPIESSIIQPISDFLQRHTMEPRLKIEFSQRKKRNSAEKLCTCKEILIVDDDSFNLLSLQTILSRFGLNVRKAFNGQQALDAIKAKKTQSCGENCKLFDLIFMDFHMPVKDGVQATREIKEMVRNREICDIPVIACTAFGARELVETWKREGMDDFLVKPLTLEKMQRVLREWNLVF